MFFKSVGATDTVTGSRHIIISSDLSYKLLLDFGLFQGEGNKTGELNRHFGFNPSEINAVLLSHAHIDHSGALPILVKNGFKGKIYCTEATKDLCEILLYDSAEIQQKDLEFVNKKRIEKKLPPIDPLYTPEDVEKTLSQISTIPFEKEFRLGPFTIMFLLSGHIPGASFIKITENQTRLLYSGDVGRYRDMLMKPPQIPPSAEYLIMESTYGGRYHNDPESPPEAFKQVIENACYKKKGILIIPAFSVGRTQEILFILNKLFNEKFLKTSLPVFVDSPLSSDATKIFHKHRYSLNKEVEKVLTADSTPFVFPTLKFTSDVKDSIQINFTAPPFIVIASSGMMDAGRIKHHLIQRLPDEKNTVLLVNYMPEHSLGKKLLNGEKVVRIFGKEVEVNARVYSMDFMSAHADHSELLYWARPLLSSNELKKVFLVHGENEAKSALEKDIMKIHNKPVIQPVKEKIYELN
jgi:metallo-beta-lactamase family protein